MRHFSLRHMATAAVAGLVITASAHATYTISNSIGGGDNQTNLGGQNFSPSVEPSSNPGLAAGDSVLLTSFQFVKGTGAAGSANTVLVIEQGAYPDFNGNPDGTFTPTTANVTGVSINSLDTSGTTVAGTALTFTFNNLQLTYGTNYTAAFATVGTGGALTFINANMKYVHYSETSPGSGIFVPDNNYGGSGNFNAAALYGPPSASGFYSGDSNAADAVFTATFEVPEPASVGALMLCGAAGLMARRRRVGAV